MKLALHYRKLWKNLKYKNRRYRKRIKNLEKGIYEDLGINEKDELIKKLTHKVEIRDKRIKKLNLEAQRYFDCAMDLINEKNIILDWLESKNNITLQQHKTIEPVIKVQEVIDKIKED